MFADTQSAFLLDALAILFYRLSPKDQQDCILQLASLNISRAVEGAERLRDGSDYAHAFIHLLEDYRVRPLNLKTRDAIFAIADDIVSSEDRRRRRVAVTSDV